MDAGTGGCEVCGDEARVVILEGYRDGQPVRRQLCLTCAGAGVRANRAGEVDAPRSRISLGSILVFAGLILGLASSLGDHVPLGGSSGLRPYQSAVFLGGLVLVILGGLMRVDFIALIGTLAFVFALVVDLFGLHGKPGFGWKQQLCLLAGVVLTLIGLAAGRVFRRRRSAAVESA